MVGAVLTRRGEPLPVDGRAEHHGRPGATETRNLERVDPDRPRSLDHDERARLHARPLHDGVVGDGVRLRQRGYVEGDALGDAVQYPRFGHDILGHGPVARQSVPLALRAEVVTPGAAQRARAADRRGRLAYDAFADRPAFDTRADRRDDTGRLMAEHDRQLLHRALALRVVPHMDVRAAYPHRVHTDEHLPGGGDRVRILADLDRVSFVRVLHKGLHWYCPSTSLSALRAPIARPVHGSGSAAHPGCCCGHRPRTEQSIATTVRFSPSIVTFRAS